MGEDDLVQLSLLRDEETDALISAGLLSRDLSLSCPLEGTTSFVHEEATVHITGSLQYPAFPVSYHLENSSLPRAVADDLRHKLREVAAEEAKINTQQAWDQREEENQDGIFRPLMVFLQMAQITADHLLEHRRSLYEKHVPRATDQRRDKHLWFLSEENVKNPVDQAQYTHDVTSLHEHAFRLLPYTKQQLIAMVAPSEQFFRVVHIEQVLRADQVARQHDFQARLRHKLSRAPHDLIRRSVPHAMRRLRHEDMLDFLVKPRVTFHGTEARSVPSIVRHGFVLPDRPNPTTGEESHEVLCGSTFGRGIYSSPSAPYALVYSMSHRAITAERQRFFGSKLFVCATVMGRAKQVDRGDATRLRQQGRADEEADSHVAVNNMEYIVFDEAQIIPVYVMHIDYGDRNSEIYQEHMDWEQYFDKASSSRRHGRGLTAEEEEEEYGMHLYAGYRKRAKQALRARAAKHFPYGFGPATGTNFVVEAVADVSDDEEEYGDYQALRTMADNDGDDDRVNQDYWAWLKVAGDEEDRLSEGAHEADEYAEQRAAMRVPDGYRRGADRWDELGTGAEAAEHARVRRQQEEDGDFVGLACLRLDEQ